MAIINSNPDPHGNGTQIEIDAAGNTMHIRALGPGFTQDVLTAYLGSLFSIEFSRHSLRPPPRPHPQDVPNWAYWGVYRYEAAAPPRVVPSAGGVQLVYEQVGPVRDITGRPADLPAYVQDIPDVTLDKIRVVVNITRAVQSQNAGLINFDIEHTYPTFRTNNAAVAWESRVIYPRLRFDLADVAGFETHAGVVQCSTLYKVEKSGARYSVRGFSFYTDDNNGHFKEARYETGARRNAFALHVLNPIHLLKDAAGAKSYVQPARFKLSDGDEFGYGGNLMYYRLRAFSIKGVCDDVPVGIYDVMRLYREWVKTRRPPFYQKHIANRTEGALDRMSPFAIVTNYGPDGPVDPSVSDARFPDLAKWLEQHPAKHGEPDVPGNQQPSLLTMLGRVRTKFNAWGLWENLGQDGSRISAGPAVCSWRPNRLDVLARGNDNALYHKAWQDGVWYPWVGLGGVLTSAPGAVSRAPNLIDVFVRGTDNALYQKSWNGTQWVEWIRFDAGLSSAPSAASWASNRLDVFVRGMDKALYHKAWQDGVWYPWANLGGGLDSAPSAVSWGPNRIDVFVQGLDAALYTKSWDGSRWHDWVRLGMPSETVKLASAPAAASWGEHHLEVYVRCTDNRLWRRTWSAGFDGAWEGGWSPWECTGPSTFKDDPAAVCWGVNRTDVFVRGADDALQHRWSAAYGRLEAQVWGQSMAPLYRFFGSPQAASSAISRDPTKFRRAMDELGAAGTDVMVTTDPLSPITDRKRFSLHLVKDADEQWKEAIPHPFPGAYGGKTCASTSVTIGGTQFNRVFLTQPGGTPLPASPPPSCGDVQTALASERRDRFGRTSGRLPSALGSGLYKSTQLQLCPTRDVEGLYLDAWLRDRLFADHVPLVEFMKHNFVNRVCYDRRHQHVVTALTGRDYNEVMGAGSWATARYKSIFARVQDLGRAGNSSFWLTTEFQPTEQLIPYFDEVYTSDRLFHFVYSNFVSPKMHLFRDWAIHPGYRETTPTYERVPPAYMLAPERDDDPLPADRKASFKVWLGKCEEYATQAQLSVARHGLAPKDYPTVTSEADAPGSYTYCRFVQDIFNLRATIFDLGPATLEGRRVCVPAILVEEPADYNDELVNTSVRASHFQMAFRDYFRHGLMLGETAILGGNQTLWAWGSSFRVARPFNDVEVLVQNVGRFDAQLGAEWRGANGGLLTDFISRPVDRLTYYRRDAQGNYFVTYVNDITTRPKISHMIWQLDEGDGGGVLYAFANVGNREARVSFRYCQGLEGTSPDARRQTVTTYVTGEGTYHASGEAWLGKVESSLVIPPRSFAGVEITKLGLPPKYRTPAW